MTIFLIRHGEKLGNASRTVQRPDDPLSPRGVAQAERLARRLAREDIGRIVSSVPLAGRSHLDDLDAVPRDSGVV